MQKHRLAIIAYYTPATGNSLQISHTFTGKGILYAADCESKAGLPLKCSLYLRQSGTNQLVPIHNRRGPHWASFTGAAYPIDDSFDLLADFSGSTPDDACSFRLVVFYD